MANGIPLPADEPPRRPSQNRLAPLYRERAQLAGGYCPAEVGLMLDVGLGRLADLECTHGRLAGDSSPVCGCWVQESGTGLRT